jgi:hypothetical protein
MRSDCLVDHSLSLRQINTHGRHTQINIMQASCQLLKTSGLQHTWVLAERVMQQSCLQAMMLLLLHAPAACSYDVSSMSHLTACICFL